MTFDDLFAICNDDIEVLVYLVTEFGHRPVLHGSMRKAWARYNDRPIESIVPAGKSKLSIFIR